MEPTTHRRSGPRSIVTTGLAALALTAALATLAALAGSASPAVANPANSLFLEVGGAGGFYSLNYERRVIDEHRVHRHGPDADLVERQLIPVPVGIEPDRDDGQRAIAHRGEGRRRSGRPHRRFRGGGSGGRERETGARDQHRSQQKRGRKFHGGSEVRGGAAGGKKEFK